MNRPEIEARARAVKEETVLVQRLRESDKDNEADRLQETYHAREMSGLASDVYLSAKGQGTAPAGWSRATDDPAALRAAGIDVSDQELRDMLQPPQSGFRAEIYIPDKAVFGEAAKLVIVYKGSTGEIIDPAAPGGRRESAGEDFLNNGQQGIGMRSDYYDRAMRLATTINRHVPGGFEIAGHSLGGGMASAASAVTGARATTFNAAGLHPDTPARFAKDNGLPTFNPQRSVHTYQTSAEVLNDVQNGMQRINEQQRRAYGLLTNETSLLLREPMMQAGVAQTLREMLPPGAQTAAAQFVEQLATKPGAEALRNIPVAAGRMEIVLEPKTRDAQNNLVDRPRADAPSQVAELAGPLSHVLHAAAKGMRDGRVIGEHFERAGGVAAHGLDKVGDGVMQAARLQGSAAGRLVDMGATTLQVGAKVTTTVYAQGRELTGWVEAMRHRVESRLQSGVMSMGAWGAGTVGMDETARDIVREADAVRATGEARATNAVGRARQESHEVRANGRSVAGSIEQGGQWVAGGLRNGFASTGAHINKGYDFAGQHIKVVSAQAPAVLASVGGIAAGVRGAAKEYVPITNSPDNVSNISQTKRLYDRIGPAFSESMARHGMDETVIPSLDAEIARQEAAARTLLRADQDRLQEGDTPEPPPLNAPAVGINHPANADFHLFKAAQAGVHGIDASVGHTPDIYSDQLAGALAAKAKQEGLQSIAQVVLSKDQRLAAAVDTLDLAAPDRHAAYVDVVGGRQQPLAVSTEQAAEVDRQRAQAANGPQMGTEQRPDGRAMG